MAEDISPSVRLLEHVLRKPVAPGANSWAHSHSETEPAPPERDSPRPTNRERYENKPMPKLPHEVSPQTRTSQAKPYIQPAIPLVSPAAQIKHRAVTDPVPPKPLFASRKPSVNQLRKKFGHSKQASTGEKPLSPTVPYPTGKAAEILEAISPKIPSRSTAPSPAHVRHSSRTDSDDTVDAGPKTSDSQDSRNPEIVAENPSTPLQDHQLQVKGHLAPPKIASYGKVGDTGIVQGQGMVRVESVRGIIEHASAGIDDSIPLSGTYSHHSSDVLQPVSYSPSNYEGVWENDPAVGYSLPPFSPMPGSFPQHQKQNQNLDGTRPSYESPISRGFAANQSLDCTVPSQQSKDTTPSVFHDDYTDASFSSSGLAPGHFGHINSRQPRGLDDNRPTGSANSWAQECSYTSGSGPVSALLPQRWPHHLNSVPSPPNSQRDYDRPGSLAAGLSQLDMTIHHHIDTAFGHLSRLITDKHDRVLDQVLRRLDNMDDGTGRTFKNVKSEIRGLNHEVTKVKSAINSFSNGNEGIKELLHGLERQMGSLEKEVGENQRVCQQIATEQTHFESESERQSRNLAHRRTESAHGALGTSQDRHLERNGGSRAASKMRTSKASSKSNRSNTVTSQPTNGLNEDRGSRREYLADVGAGRGPVPDIRDHPAYAGIPQSATQMYDQNGVPVGLAYAGVPYGTQQFGDGGWYHQAYGSN